MEIIYQKHGFKNRADYLMYLSEEYGVPYDVVRGMAAVLGEEEDFDGLVSALEDWDWGE